MTCVTAKKVDVFQSLDVSFSGFEPEGEVSLENTATDPFLQNVVYTVERHGGLKNGDVITVKANYKPTTVEQYGCIAQERTHQYTVEGLGAYLFDRSQLDRAWLDTMVEAGAQTIEMYSDDSNSAPEIFVQMLSPNIKTIGASVLSRTTVKRFPQVMYAFLTRKTEAEHPRRQSSLFLSVP